MWRMWKDLFSSSNSWTPQSNSSWGQNFPLRILFAWCKKQIWTFAASSFYSLKGGSCKMSDMWQEYPTEKSPKSSHERPHRWDSVQLLIVSQEIHAKMDFDHAFENTQWRKTKQMQPMWLCILSGRPFENPQWRKAKQMMQPVGLCIIWSKYIADTFEETLWRCNQMQQQLRLFVLIKYKI